MKKTPFLVAFLIALLQTFEVAYAQKFYNFNAAATSNVTSVYSDIVALTGTDTVLSGYINTDSTYSVNSFKSGWNPTGCAIDSLFGNGSEITGTISKVASAFTYLNFELRGSGKTFGSTGYFMQLYTYSGTDTVRIYRNAGNNTLTLLATFAHEFAVGQTFSFSIASDKVMKARVGNDSTTVTDNTFDPATWYFQIFGTSNGAGTNAGMRIDNLSAKAIGGAPASDVTAPTVGLTAPANGATIPATTLTVTDTSGDYGTGATGVNYVQFYKDGAYFATDNVSPYSVTTDMSGEACGTQHTFYAIAFDNAGNNAQSATRTVTMQTPSQDTLFDANSVTIQTSLPLTTSSNITITATSAHQFCTLGGVDSLYIFVDGTFISSLKETTTPYAMSLTSNLPNGLKTVGNHTITVRATIDSSVFHPATIITKSQVITITATQTSTMNVMVWFQKETAIRDQTDMTWSDVPFSTANHWAWFSTPVSATSPYFPPLVTAADSLSILYNTPNYYNPTNEDHLARFVDSVHAHGAKAHVTIAAVAAFGGAAYVTNWRTVFSDTTSAGIFARTAWAWADRHGIDGFNWDIENPSQGDSDLVYICWNAMRKYSYNRGTYKGVQLGDANRRGYSTWTYEQYIYNNTVGHPNSRVLPRRGLDSLDALTPMFYLLGSGRGNANQGYANALFNPQNTLNAAPQYGVGYDTHVMAESLFNDTYGGFRGQIGYGISRAKSGMSIGTEYTFHPGATGVGAGHPAVNNTLPLGSYYIQHIETAFDTIPTFRDDSAKVSYKLGTYQGQSAFITYPDSFSTVNQINWLKSQGCQWIFIWSMQEAFMHRNYGGAPPTTFTKHGGDRNWFMNLVAQTAFGGTIVQQPDTNKPTASITFPTSGSTISRTVTLAGTFGDNVGVTSVQWKVDGTSVGTSSTSPFSLSLNTVTLANGAHSFRAIPSDLAGNKDSTSVTATVFNDTTAPTVSITDPTADTTITSTITVKATANDNVNVAGVQFKLDNVNLGAEDVTSPYSASLVAGSYANGQHSLIATARDTTGNTKVSSIRTVTITNAVQDTTKPTLSTSISPPPIADTIRGTVMLMATASDNNIVIAVRFLLDNNIVLGVDSTSPYSVSYSTLGTSNGGHYIYTIAVDGAGNLGTVIDTIFVNNASGNGIPANSLVIYDPSLADGNGAKNWRPPIGGTEMAESLNNAARTITQPWTFTGGATFIGQGIDFGGTVPDSSNKANHAVLADSTPKAALATLATTATSATSSSTSVLADTAKQVRDNAIVTGKIADGTILFADIGQNSATSGQVMKWNGSAWAAAADANTAGSPTNQQTLDTLNARTVDSLKALWSFSNVSGTEKTLLEYTYNGTTQQYAVKGGNGYFTEIQLANTHNYQQNAGDIGYTVTPQSWRWNINGQDTIIFETKDGSSTPHVVFEYTDTTGQVHRSHTQQSQFGTFMKYNDFSLEQPGMSAILDTLNRGSLSAVVSGTNFNNTATGHLYEFDYSAFTTTTSSSACTITLNVTYNDGNSKTITSSSFDLQATNSTGQVNGAVRFYVASGTPQWSTAIATGSNTGGLYTVAGALKVIW